MTKRTIQNVAFGFLVALIVIFSLFPATVMLSTALKSLPDVYQSPATWIPNPPQWGNFVKIFTGVNAPDGSRIPFLTWFYNSIKVASLTTLFGLLVIIPAAYALAKMSFVGKQILIFLLLAIQLFAPVIVILPLFNIVVELGLLDTHLSLVLVNTVFVSAFATWLLAGFFGSVPSELEDAAVIDGCNSFQLLTYIFLPLVTPGLIVTAIFMFIYTWNEFLFAFTFINRDHAYTFMVGLYTMLSASAVSSVQWNFVMMSSFYSSLPILILFLLIRRHLVRGLMSGSVKQ